MRQALEKITALVEESDRLKEKANAAWVKASGTVLSNRGLKPSEARVIVEREEGGVALYLQQEIADDHQVGVDKEEPALVE